MHRVASFDHFFEDVVRDARRREWWIPTRANECVNELSEDDVVLRLVGHRPSASPLAWAASAELPQRRSGRRLGCSKYGPLRNVSSSRSLAVPSEPTLARSPTANNANDVRASATASE